MSFFSIIRHKPINQVSDVVNKTANDNAWDGIFNLLMEEI